MEILKRQWMRRKEELFVCFVALAGGYVLGNLISGMLERGTEALRPGILLGGILGYGMALLTHMVYATFSMPGEFNLAVSMGGTRKQFLWGYLLFGLAELVGVQIMTGILQGLVTAIYGIWSGGSARSASLMPEGFLWGYLLLLELGILMVEVLVGAVVLRFGTRVLWGVMVVMFVLPTVRRGLIDRGLLPEYVPVTQALLEGDLSGVCTLPRLLEWLVLLLLLLAAVWGLLRKQQVTG